MKQRYTNMDKQELGTVWDARTEEITSNRCRDTPAPGVNAGDPPMCKQGYTAFDAEGKPIIKQVEDM